MILGGTIKVLVEVLQVLCGDAQECGQGAAVVFGGDGVLAIFSRREGKGGEGEGKVGMRAGVMRPCDVMEQADGEWLSFPMSEVECGVSAPAKGPAKGGGNGRGWGGTMDPSFLK